MDFLNALNELKNASGRMAIEKGQTGAIGSDHGKPGDYGFAGRSRNLPVSKRMAGGSIMNAVAGNLINAGLEVTEPYIESGLQSMISSIKGSNVLATK